MFVLFSAEICILLAYFHSTSFVAVWVFLKEFVPFDDVQALYNAETVYISKINRIEGSGTEIQIIF